MSVAVVALVLGAAGCGSSRAGPETAQLEFAKQANTVCTQRATAVRAAIAKRGGNQAVVGRALPALQDGAAALAALEPPPKAVKAFGYFVGEETEQIARLRGALAGRPLPHSGRRDQRLWGRSHVALAVQLGITRCLGQGGLPTFG
jgi:hypothetical protein